MEIEIKTSVRAKKVRITVYKDGRVVVTKPQRGNEKAVALFIQEKKLWIERAVQKMKERQEKNKEKHESMFQIKHTTKEQTLLKKQAYDVVMQRIEALNTPYRFLYKRITIRNQSTRWGSCSLKKNLSFNYRIVFLPEILQDYLIVHELCHLGEMNHSDKFWNLVAKTFPNYRELRRQMKN